MIDLDNTEISKPAIAAALRELESENGTLTAEIVYAAARSPNHALHGCGFVWNQKEAAHKYNLEVARSLIRTVKYQIMTSDHGVIKAPVYVRDPGAPSAVQGYVALRRVVARGPDAFAIVHNEIELALSHMGRAMAVAIALGFADVLGKLIKQTRSFKIRIESEMKSRGDEAA
jgi:hypothetical protein